MQFTSNQLRASRAALSACRSGITLMEVLISMFVLLFGLMGVAAIIPVGNHFVVEGEKFERGNVMATNAFQEIRARGLASPETWMYSGNTVSTVTNTPAFIQPPIAASMDPGNFNADIAVGGPGHAFVIDPMSVADASSPRYLDLWPIFTNSGNQSDQGNSWNSGADPNSNYPSGLAQLSGVRWPVRRITLPTFNGNTGYWDAMPLSVAETVFRLQDELSLDVPERDDYPGIMRWQVDGATQQRLTREYKSNFSWLATVVPLSERGRNALQPSFRENHPYEVSVVVFYKRVNTPAPQTERLVRAEMLPGGELVMYGNSAAEIEPKFEKVKAGDWVAVMGVNQTTGAFMLKWYRLLSLDEEAYQDELPSDGSQVSMRRAMVLGPDWHFNNGAGGLPASHLRVVILPGVASVVTREMELTEPALGNVAIQFPPIQSGSPGGAGR